MFRILRGTKITHRTPAPPAALDERDGLAYALFEPEREPRGAPPRCVSPGRGSRGAGL